jgi:hypothetical protein
LFEVGHQGSSTIPEAFVPGSGGTSVLGKPIHIDARVATAPPQKLIVTVVGGAVVDGQQFPVRERLPTQGVDSAI